MASSRRRGTWIGLLLATVVLVVACAKQAPPTGPTHRQAEARDALDTILAQAEALWERGDYGAVAALMRSTGRERYSYYRMDEVLFWLGRANLESGALPKAERCFGLIEQYYPRSPVRIEELPAWWDALEARRGQATQPAPNEPAARRAGFAAQEQPPVASAAKPPPLQTTAEESDLGPPISNIFYETDIRQALADIAAQAGVSIVPGQLVRGYVSAEFDNVPLELCLEQMLTPLGLTYQQLDGYYLVAAPIKESPAYPFMTETIRLHPRHLSAAEVPNLLPAYFKDLLRVDPAANALVITASPKLIARFREHLAAIDVPPHQVMIEALIVEMSETARRSLGLDWDWSGTRKNSAFRIAQLFPDMTDSSLTAQWTKLGETHGALSYDVHATLRALAEDGSADIRAYPRVATQEGKEATIQIGKEAYYSLVRGNVNYPYVTLEKITTGITLRITPLVVGSGEIKVQVLAEVSDVSGSGANDLPVTSVRSVQSEIRVPNGQMLGIGGLVTESRAEKSNGIPLLKDIPWIGKYLFSHTTTTSEDAEVVILITPHLLLDPAIFDEL